MARPATTPRRVSMSCVRPEAGQLAARVGGTKGGGGEKGPNGGVASSAALRRRRERVGMSTSAPTSRAAEPGERKRPHHRPRLGDAGPEPSHHLRGGRVGGLEEVVVVALHDEARLGAADDPVQHQAASEELRGTPRRRRPGRRAPARSATRSPRWSFGSMLVPVIVAYVTPPPSAAGARPIHATAPSTSARHPKMIRARARPMSVGRHDGQLVGARRRRLRGLVVSQVTEPVVLTQAYHAPPETSWARTVFAAVGAMVKATWSTSRGSVPVQRVGDARDGIARDRPELYRLKKRGPCWRPCTRRRRGRAPPPLRPRRPGGSNVKSPLSSSVRLAGRFSGERQCRRPLGPIRTVTRTAMGPFG